jgi:opacity protein-like surface antigen
MTLIWETKMKKTILASSLILLGLSTSAFSANENYFSAGYGMLTYSEPDLDIDGISTLNLGLGHMFTPNWGIEGRVSLGLASGDKDTTVLTVPVNIEVNLDSSYALLGVANYPVSEKFNVFVKAGLASVARSGTGTIISTGQSVDIPSDTATSVTYMGGASYAFTKRFLVEFEAGSYYDKDNISVTGVGLGIKSTF